MKDRMHAKEMYMSVILLLVFAIVYFFSFIDYPYRVIILLIVLAMSVAMPFLFRDTKIIISPCRMIWSVVICITLIEITRCVSPDKHTILFYCFILLLLITSKPDCIGAFHFSKKIIYLMGIFFTVGTFFPIILPGVYNGLIVPLMRQNGDYGILDYVNQGVYSGFTNQAGINAVYISFGLASSFLLFLFCDTTKEKIKLSLIIGIELLAILLTAKRGPLLYVLLSMLLVYYFNSKRGKKLTNIVKIVFVLTAFLFIAYSYVPAVNVIFTKFLEGNVGSDFSSGRYSLYERAWNYFHSNKAFGIGWTNFRYFNSRYIDVHNVYLQLLCETGIVGAIPFYFAFIYSFIHTIRILNQLKEVRGGASYTLILFSLFLQSFFLLHSFTSNALYDYYISFFYFLGIVICDNVQIDYIDTRNSQL